MNSWEHFSVYGITLNTLQKHRIRLKRNRSCSQGHRFTFADVVLLNITQNRVIFYSPVFAPEIRQLLTTGRFRTLPWCAQYFFNPPTLSGYYFSVHRRVVIRTGTSTPHV